MTSETKATDKPGDPADKGADQFQPTVSHRSGYGDDKLARLVDYLRRQPRATLASGEGALLLAEIDRLHAAELDGMDHYADARAEIDRLRDDLQKQADWADWAKGEMERLTRILAALLEPSEVTMRQMRETWLNAAVAAAEQEVGP